MYNKQVIYAGSMASQPEQSRTTVQGENFKPKHTDQKPVNRTGEGKKKQGKIAKT